MTRNEFRSLILSAEEGVEFKFEITEKEYPILRQEAKSVRSYGYSIIFWTKRLGSTCRRAIFMIEKTGDVEQYKKAIKWE